MVAIPIKSSISHRWWWMRAIGYGFGVDFVDLNVVLTTDNDTEQKEDVLVGNRQSNGKLSRWSFSISDLDIL